MDQDAPPSPAMFDAFSEDARRVLFYSRLAVSLIGGSAIDEPHLVVGILIARPDALTRFVDAAHWTEARLEERLRALVPDAPAPVSDSGTSLASRAEHALRTFVADPRGAGVHHEIPFAAGAQRVVTGLAEAARRDGGTVVAEHYIWAMTHDPSMPVGALLAEAGVDREAVGAFLRHPEV